MIIKQIKNKLKAIAAFVIAAFACGVSYSLTESDLISIIAYFVVAFVYAFFISTSDSERFKKTKVDNLVIGGQGHGKNVSNKLKPMFLNETQRELKNAINEFISEAEKYSWFDWHEIVSDDENKKPLLLLQHFTQAYRKIKPLTNECNNENYILRIKINLVRDALNKGLYGVAVRELGDLMVYYKQYAYCINIHTDLVNMFNESNINNITP